MAAYLRSGAVVGVTGGVTGDAVGSTVVGCSVVDSAGILLPTAAFDDSFI